MFPGDVLNADDAQAPPEMWPAWTDEHWTEGPEPEENTDHLSNAAEPSESDMSDFADWKRECAARDFLDRSETLTLDALVDHVASHFGTWGNGAGDLISETLAALAFKIRLCDATTPAEFAARSDALDQSARDCWEAIGYEQGRREAGVDCFA